MPTIRLHTHIHAPLEACFNAARDIDLHCLLAAHSGERAVAGTTTGLISLHQSVTFQAKHFGLTFRFTSKITDFHPPRRFTDQMTQGPFSSFHHLHEFTPSPPNPLPSTLMTDTLTFTSPFGKLGKLADALFLKRHLATFLQTRNAALKKYLESLPLPPSHA